MLNCQQITELVTDFYSLVPASGFGQPESDKATLGAGQPARLTGMSGRAGGG